MAMSKLETIMDIFANGKSDTPVAIIQDGTTEQEKMVIGKVKDYLLKHNMQISNPAIIMVGEVVNLHPSFIKTAAQKITAKQDLQNRI